MLLEVIYIALVTVDFIVPALFSRALSCDSRLSIRLLWLALSGGAHCRTAELTTISDLSVLLPHAKIGSGYGPGMEPSI